MHFVADAITDPAKILSFPLVIFRTSATFALAMAKETSDFVQSLFKLFV